MMWTFWSFWWLIFPIGFFLFGAWDRWLHYQRSRDTLEVLKQYTAQGKEPPPELLRQVQGEPMPPPPPYDDDRPWRYRRRYWRYYHYGPFWAWRGVIVTGALAAGFWMASTQGLVPGADGIFHFVAIILGCVAAANLAMAILATIFRGR